MKPDNQTIDDTLDAIQRATDTHPTRLLARQKVTEFRLDREKGTGLPVSNVHDDKGAKVLDVNEVLKRTLPGSLGKR